MLSFQAAGIVCQIAAEPALLEVLQAAYRSFPRASGGEAEAAVHWEGLECRWGGGRAPMRSCRVIHEAIRPAITNILMARLIHLAHPEYLFFHGNALVQEPGGQALALVGPSGSGKTTLSRQIMEIRPEFSLASEDLLIIAPAPDARLIPFPRTPTLRPPFDSKPSLQWGSMDMGGKEKALAPAPGGNPPVCHGADKPLALEGICVAILSSINESALSAAPAAPAVPATPSASAAPAPRGGSSEAAAQQELVWVTFGDESTLENLRSANLPVVGLQRDGAAMRIHYSRPLSEGEGETEDEVFSRHGAFILKVASRPASSPVPVPAGGGHAPSFVHAPLFAAAPSIASVAPSRGVAQLISQRVRLERKDAACGSGDLFWRAAGAFRSGRFAEMTPGGTPGESARELLRWAAGG